MIAKALTIFWAHCCCEWYCFKHLLSDGHAPRKYVQKHSFYGTTLIAAMSCDRSIVTFYRQKYVRNSAQAPADPV